MCTLQKLTDKQSSLQAPRQTIIIHLLHRQTIISTDDIRNIGNDIGNIGYDIGNIRETRMVKDFQHKIPNE